MDLQNDFHQYFAIDAYERYGVELDLADDFPAYFNYSGEVVWQLNDKFSLGGGFIYQSTGARSYYEDYSEKMNYDVKIQGYGPYVNVVGKIYKNPLFDLSLQLKPMILFSNQDIISELQVFDYKESDNIEISGYNYGIEPAIRISKDINRLSFSLNFGYYLDLYRGNLEGKIMGDTFDIYIPNTDDKLKNNWYGLRIFAGVGYHFIK